METCGLCEAAAVEGAPVNTLPVDENEGTSAPSSGATLTGSDGGGHGDYVGATAEQKALINDARMSGVSAGQAAHTAAADAEAAHVDMSPEIIEAAVGLEEAAEHLEEVVDEWVDPENAARPSKDENEGTSAPSSGATLTGSDGVGHGDYVGATDEQKALINDARMSGKSAGQAAQKATADAEAAHVDMSPEIIEAAVGLEEAAVGLEEAVDEWVDPRNAARPSKGGARPSKLLETSSNSKAHGTNTQHRPQHIPQQVHARAEDMIKVVRDKLGPSVDNEMANLRVGIETALESKAD